MFFDNVNQELEYHLSESVDFGSYSMIVFIENEEDQRFWDYVIQKAKSPCNVKYHSYFKHKSKDDDSQITVSQGKQQLFKFNDAILGFKGQALICIDSDFDYIRNLHNINENPYIIQTYTYSVESYMCCAKTLNDLLKELLVPTELFDFIEFFSNFSTVIRDLTIYHILLKETQEDKLIKEVYTSFFTKVNSIKNKNSLHELYDMSELQLLIDEKIENIKDTYQISDTYYKEIESKVNDDLLINEKMLHMYISGHLIFNLTKNILTKCLSIVRNDKKEEAKSLYTGESLKNKLREINNKKKCLDTALSLKYNDCYINSNCTSFQVMIDNIKAI